MLRRNPHFHSIVLEGGFDEQGTFLYIRATMTRDAVTGRLQDGAAVATLPDNSVLHDGAISG